MTPFDVRLDRRVEREIGALPPHLRDRFEAAFAELAEDPFRPRSGCDIRRLKAHDGRFSIRVGRYRALYEVQGLEVRVLGLGPRKNIYR